MDALEKWMIIQFTPYQTTTPQKRMGPQQHLLKSSLLLNGKFSIQVHPPNQQRRSLPSFLSVSFFYAPLGQQSIKPRGRYYAYIMSNAINVFIWLTSRVLYAILHEHFYSYTVILNRMYVKYWSCTRTYEKKLQQLYVQLFPGKSLCLWYGHIKKNLFWICPF